MQVDCGIVACEHAHLNGGRCHIRKAASRNIHQPAGIICQAAHVLQGDACHATWFQSEVHTPAQSLTTPSCIRSLCNASVLREHCTHCKPGQPKSRSTSTTVCCSTRSMPRPSTAAKQQVPSWLPTCIRSLASNMSPAACNAAEYISISAKATLCSSSSGVIHDHFIPQHSA